REEETPPTTPHGPDLAQVSSHLVVHPAKDIFEPHATLSRSFSYCHSLQTIPSTPPKCCASQDTCTAASVSFVGFSDPPTSSHTRHYHLLKTVVPRKRAPFRSIISCLPTNFTNFKINRALVLFCPTSPFHSLLYVYPNY